jgi:hypothetical protein
MFNRHVDRRLDGQLLGVCFFGLLVAAMAGYVAYIVFGLWR